jgi:hypothetical protein
VWSLAAAVFVVDFVAIGLTSWLHVAGFYGGQPFKVAGYPLWWASVDIAIVVLGGASVYLLAPRLRGRAQIYLLLVSPIVVGASGGIVAGPVSTALNSGWSAAGKTLAALVTIGLAAALVGLVIRLLAAVSPSTVSAQSLPGSPDTPPPGWVPAEPRYSPASGVR